LSLGSDSWRRIRRLRANPPLLAGREVDEARRRVFQAALTQAEELWEAASAVSAASRPLPLYYCLNQAGRAICAAWTTDGPWEPTGHGLTSRRQVAEADLGVPSFAVQVSGDPAKGMFSMVAAATDSTVFEGSTTVAALWRFPTSLTPT
jgi:YaaC-like Protein